MAWLDEHALAVAAIASMIAAFAAIAGWLCTLVMDYRNEKRLRKLRDEIKKF
jgi:hypothetical protein